MTPIPIRLRNLVMYLENELLNEQFISCLHIMREMYRLILLMWPEMYRAAVKQWKEEHGQPASTR